MKIFSKTLLLFLAFGLVGCVLPKVDTPAEEIAQLKREQVTDHIYVLYGGRGRGANVGVVVGDDGIVLIDSMNAKSSYQLLSAVKQVSDKPIINVINTHTHADHTGGNSALIKEGVLTIAHENSRYSPFESQQLISDGFTRFIGDEELVAYHVVAHTYHDLLIYLKTSNVLFVGDTFTNIWHPTANIRGLESETDLVQKVLSLIDEDTVIVPGHGHLDSARGLRRSLRNNKVWYKRIAELFEQGLDVQSMADDPQLNKIRVAFVQHRIPPEMPDRRFLSFIQRTLSADFVDAIPMDADELNGYAGTYNTNNGESIELIVENGELFARMKGGFYEQLLPVAPLSFRARFELETSYDFSRNSKGVPNSFTLRYGEQNIQAYRVE